MGNGEWGMGIGEWGMGNGEWETQVLMVWLQNLENECTNSKNWVFVLGKTEIILILAQSKQFFNHYIGYRICLIGYKNLTFENNVFQEINTAWL